MISVEVQFEVDDQPIMPEDVEEDEYELAQMLEHTSASLQQQIARKLSKLELPPLEDGEATPAILVTVIYDRETGQMELNYHVDNCSGLTLIRLVQALNH